MTSYPIDNIIPQMKQAVAQNAAVVLHAPPGAGKTTRVPLALLDVVPPATRIVMLEPRRIAAVSAARWMARTLKEQPGETVGYAIRFDSKISARTRVEVVTEGILTRRIQSDPGLENVSLIIFDEFHERSIHADLALALCLDVRKGLRPDLKIIVMSATLDYGPIATLLGDAPVVASAGKAFPVEERYLDLKPGPASTRAAAAIRTALRETNGDILAFFPGAGEIRATAKELQASLDMTEERLALHPLYGDLPFEEQELAIQPSKDRRKIVLATNIAETSLTIEGVRVVVDSGLTRRLRHDPSTGMNRLVTVPVSRASAEQRKGRAGRLGPGVCYRLYAEHELRGMPAFAPAEILESDLAPLALELHVWGVKDPSSLSWLDAPPAAAWNAALELLRELGALDATGSVTATGREMARLPLHPRLSRLMIRARELGCLRLGSELSAVLSERDLLRRSATAEPGAGERDVAERIELLRRWQSGKDTGPGADHSALRAVDRTAHQLQRLMSGVGVKTAEVVDPDLVSRLLLTAYPDRICKQRQEGAGSYVLVQGRGVRLSPGSHLINNSLLVAVTVDAGEKAEGFIHIAAPVSEELIRSECSGIIETARRVEWDHKQGRIASVVEERIGAVVLSRRSFVPGDEDAVPILCDIIRRDRGILRFSSAAIQFRSRVGLIARAFPEEAWPDLSDESLLSRPDEWLAPWLSGVRTAQALQGLDILPALKAKLSRDQLRLLEERAPLHAAVPSGSKVKIDYSTGEQPILAVKLQELFGLADTPRIAGGRVRLLLHLLSPAQRPVQITQDLKGFWDSVYPLVKKDLKGRYPRHPWPEDPWNAVPTRRAKRRGD